MQKDFITVTPDSGGSGSTTVTVAASANQTESTRSTSLSVAGGGMTRTVGASQAAGVVTWNYYFSVTPTSLSFVAGGETKSVTVTSYRKKVINGVETSTQENVPWTVTGSSGFNVADTRVVSEPNPNNNSRTGTATYKQDGTNKTVTVDLAQAAPKINTLRIEITTPGSTESQVYMFNKGESRLILLQLISLLAPELRIMLKLSGIIFEAWKFLIQILNPKFSFMQAMYHL